MTPVDRLVVALDVPAPRAGELFSRLSREVGITRFKVNAATLLELGGRAMINNMVADGARLMLDLKVYDVGSTVERIVRQAHAMGAEMITVHVDSVKAAVEATNKLARPSILAVGGLTTDGTAIHPGLDGYAGYQADGIVCHPRLAMRYREAHPGKLIVCPGVRPAGSNADEHDHPRIPAEAIRNGADLIVVGRPITGADDQVAAAREIVEEIGGVT